MLASVSVEKKSIMGPLKEICSISPYSFKEILDDFSNIILEYILDKYDNRVHLMVDKFDENKKKNYVIVIYPSYRSDLQEMRVKLCELTKNNDIYYVSDINDQYISLMYYLDDDDGADTYEQNLYDKMDKLCLPHIPVEELNRYKSLIRNICRHPIMDILNNMVYDSEYIEYAANSELCGVTCRYISERETIVTFHYSEKVLIRKRELIIHHPDTMNGFQVFELVLKATRMMMDEVKYNRYR